jgi:hypothetical protein
VSDFGARTFPLILATALIWVAVVVGDDRRLAAAILQVAAGCMLGGWAFLEGRRIGRNGEK